MLSLTALPSSTPPQRIKKYRLIVVWAGELKLEIDGKSIRLKQNQLVTLTSGQIHRFLHSNSAEGQILDFTYDFFCKTDADIELVFHNGLFCHFDQNEVISLDQPLPIRSILDEISQEIQSEPYQSAISIHALIQRMLVLINRTKIRQGHEIWKPDALFLQFLEAIRNGFDHRIPVRAYAERLHTTEAKLNELAKLHAGKTAQQVQHGLIVSEAQRQLTYETTTIKEIAFALGFTDPFYFSNFFKKHTGKSPAQFREAVHSPKLP